MMKLRLIILCSFLVGCSPFPIHYSCDTPQLKFDEKSEDVSYFDTNGYFEKFCPTEVPEQFTYRISENADVTIRVRGEWLDLKPIKDGGPFKLAGQGLRELDFEGYTQAVRVDSLVNNMLALSTPDSITININFNLVGCTCVTYDSI